MTFAAYIQKRRKRYLAQVLGAFEDRIEPHLPDETADHVKEFKALVRMRINALAVDATNAHRDTLGGLVRNGLADDIRDRIADTA